MNGSGGPGTLAWMLASQAVIARESDNKWADLHRIRDWDPNTYRNTGDDK